VRRAIRQTAADRRSSWVITAVARMAGGAAGPMISSTDRDRLAAGRAGLDDRVEGDMERGRALGGPDRPDRRAQRLPAGVPALGAIQHGVSE
jgi:hypothetical protein